METLGDVGVVKPTQVVDMDALGYGRLQRSPYAQATSREVADMIDKELKGKKMYV